MEKKSNIKELKNLAKYGYGGKPVVVKEPKGPRPIRGRIVKGENNYHLVNAISRNYK